MRRILQDGERPVRKVSASVKRTVANLKAKSEHKAAKKIALKKAAARRDASRPVPTGTLPVTSR
jgi:hypothetical protein